jgi:hypothetical protein
MLELEVLVLELGTVYRLTASAIAGCKVTTLNHELFDHTVEHGALVVKRFATLANALLSGAESAEVLGRLGHDIIEELEGDATGTFAAYADVEEDAAVVLLGLFGAGHLVSFFTSFLSRLDDVEDECECALFRRNWELWLKGRDQLEYSRRRVLPCSYEGSKAVARALFCCLYVEGSRAVVVGLAGELSALQA